MRLPINFIFGREAAKNTTQLIHTHTYMLLIEKERQRNIKQDENTAKITKVQDYGVGPVVASGERGTGRGYIVLQSSAQGGEVL